MKIEIIQNFANLETLELGECCDFPLMFGTNVILKLQKLECLRLEKIEGSSCILDILTGISKLENLKQLELVKFDVKNGFDNYLSKCKNIQKLLIVPNYISRAATSNNMILGGVTKLSNNLTHLIWGITQELINYVKLFNDKYKVRKSSLVDSVVVLKPVPCLKLIEDFLNDESKDLKGIFYSYSQSYLVNRKLSASKI